MGYTFNIGNAVPEFDKEYFPELYAKWAVEGKTLKKAPKFINDEMTGQSNSRSPSYTTWSDFCKTVGLYDFFYNPQGHLHAGHPGCIGIEQKDADLVTAALRLYEKKAIHPPGFSGWEGPKEGDPEVDAHLARLIWLEFWMQWAVKNCETPAIENH